MIEKNILEKVLARAMATGADFAEVFVERTKENEIVMTGGKLDSIHDGLLSGAGIRVFNGLRSVHVSTTDITQSGLMACAAKAADVIGQSRSERMIRLTERLNGDRHPIKTVPSSVSNAVKLEIVKEADAAARGYDSAIAQVKTRLMDFDHNILIANSEGLYTADRQIRTRLMVVSTASDGMSNQQGFSSPGRRMGLEMFETILPSEVGRAASAQAMTMLKAGYCPAGRMAVAIENGFGGVIFHEACGHSLEASSVAYGQSEFAGKLGLRVACPKVTAVDDGTIPGAWGSVNIDDEGTPSRRNVLIENGILKSYLVDRFNGRRMGMPSTGSARRQSYLFEPTSRMTNTFLLNGPDRNEDIIASIEYGLYAKSMGGGSVNPVTGAFNFSVREGYLIRNGKVCEPVRGASLIGNGAEVLSAIDMVGQNLATAQGMCGSSSGSIPTDVGQPLIRVSSITVGGR
ncbi:TldD/PmbA family protein [Lachnotalea sp. AF33-28]|uniref:TldD/PmbA family protein n=1 Tax=Lachnotalea sp. AF33-28 TaxID=2292046 RepID=UPI000E47D72F|nr:TldD/PmbA family protein [Lachnotalea sp. AF33-28]RHP30476.1 TldD/PmbA family protein [Lachnotalea sp. AF33-28]